jgi:putative ABC transport system ATP-binding protein
MTERMASEIIYSYETSFRNEVLDVYNYLGADISGLEVEVFDKLNEKGELVVIVGPSGAGKTTILNILGGMDKATSGEVIVDGKEITKLNDKKLIEYRRNDIGFVFQFYNLVQNLTAKENVELATQICSDALDVNEILEKVGLSDRKDNFPAQLSGGEQQRVAIARAIAKNPKLLLCDEPTGALDYKTGKSILKLLQEMARKEKMTVAIITHNGAIAPMADKVIHFKNGTAEKIEINDNPISIDEIEW